VFKKYLWFSLAIIALTLLIKLGLSGGDETSEWSVLRAVLRPFAQVYLGIFGNPASGVVLSFLIIASMGWLLLRYWRGLVAPIKRDLEGVAAAIRAVGGEPGDPRALPQVRQAMHSSPLLADDWDSFETGLIRRQGDSGESLRSTTRPAACFTLASLRDRGADLKAWLPLSGYFVGIGLVLTFMGLVAGLYFASRGMKTADLNQARSALVALLNSSTFKFATSIAGILSSLVLSVVVRAGIALVDQRLVLVVRALEQRFPLITGEQLMQDQIELTRAQIQRLDALLSDAGRRHPAETP
jgi:hypothetical protein